MNAACGQSIDGSKSPASRRAFLLSASRLVALLQRSLRHQNSTPPVAIPQRFRAFTGLTPLRLSGLQIGHSGRRDRAVKALIFHEFSGQSISPPGIVTTPGHRAAHPEKKDSGVAPSLPGKENVKSHRQLRAGCLQVAKPLRGVTQGSRRSGILRPFESAL